MTQRPLGPEKRGSAIAAAPAAASRSSTTLARLAVRR